MPNQAKLLLSSVAAFLAALMAVSAAWPILEPWICAHRGYVREQVVTESQKLRTEFSPTRAGLYDIQLSIAKTRRATINDRILSHEIDALKSDNNEELLKRRQQIERLKEEREEIDADIKSIQQRRDRD